MGQTTPKARAECLLKLADSIEQNALEFARLESQNCGKPLHCVINDEIPAIVDVFRFCRRGPLFEWAGGGRISGRTYVDDPPGSDWRGCLYRAVELSAHDGGSKLAPALAAGNCVVIKPSEITPLTALKLAALAKDIFPPGGAQCPVRTRADCWRCIDRS